MGEAAQVPWDKIIGAAAASPLGIVSLGLLVVAFVAVMLFRNAGERSRVIVFLVVVVLALIGLAVAIQREKASFPMQTQDEEDTSVITPADGSADDPVSAPAGEDSPSPAYTETPMAQSDGVDASVETRPGPQDGTTDEAGDLRVYNYCDEPVRLYVYLLDQSDPAAKVIYQDYGANTYGPLEQGGRVLQPADGRLVYYAVDSDGREWAGDSVVTYDNVDYPMQEQHLPTEEGRYVLQFCE